MRIGEPPVVKLGPGGAYTVSYHEDRTGPHLLPRFVRAAGDRPLPGPRPEGADGTGLLLLLAGRLWVAEQALAVQATPLARSRSVIAALARRLAGSFSPVFAPQALAGVVGRGICMTSQEAAHESHSQATEDPPAHPRLAGASWLFADDAGARRRDRRQQGHRVRARGGPHQEGRPGPRAQQGTLFVHR